MLIRLKGTPIGFYHLNDEAFLRGLHAYCLSKKDEFQKHIADWKAQGFPASEAHYSSYNLFSLPGAPQMLLEHLRDILPQFLPHVPQAKSPLWLMGWANYLQPGAVFQMHDHGNCTMFGHVLLEDQGTRNLYLADGTLEVHTKPGMITLVGDGKLMHGTTPVVGDKERVSIGFDFFSGAKPLNPRAMLF